MFYKYTDLTAFLNDQSWSAHSYLWSTGDWSLSSQREHSQSASIISFQFYVLRVCTHLFGIGISASAMVYLLITKEKPTINRKWSWGCGYIWKSSRCLLMDPASDEIRPRGKRSCCTARCFSSGCRSRDPGLARTSAGPVSHTWGVHTQQQWPRGAGSSARRSHLENTERTQAYQTAHGVLIYIYGILFCFLV